MAVLDSLRAFGGATPWLWPGAAVAGPAAVLLARPAGRLLRARAWHAGLLLAGLAGIALVTLTPSETGSLVTGHAGSAPGFCDLHAHAPTLAPRLEERSLNVALFLPAGLAVGMLPAPRVRWWALAALLTLPAVIEGCQFLGYPELGRSCQAQDVVQNVTGAAIGATLGLLLRLPLRPVVDPAARPGRVASPAASAPHDRVGA
jgi:hypothetical protein